MNKKNEADLGLEEYFKTKVNGKYPLDGRALTNEDKREVIERLYAVWCSAPELRLGQMISNLDYDFFFTEDEEFIYRIENKYRKQLFKE